MINHRTKVNVYTPSSFGGVEAYARTYVNTHVQTKSRFMCIDLRMLRIFKQFQNFFKQISFNMIKITADEV